MEAGRAFEAEVVYWEDLRHNPENSRALFGLTQSLRAQGKNALAAVIERRFQKASSQADIKLESSGF
jgi:hypothetical protein